MAGTTTRTEDVAMHVTGARELIRGAGWPWHDSTDPLLPDPDPQPQFMTFHLWTPTHWSLFLVRARWLDHATAEPRWPVPSVDWNTEFVLAVILWTGTLGDGLTCESVEQTDDGVEVLMRPIYPPPDSIRLGMEGSPWCAVVLPRTDEIEAQPLTTVRLLDPHYRTPSRSNDADPGKRQ